MGTEIRVIGASFFAGVTDIAVGLGMHYAGLTDWWWNYFHTFGILGVGMLAYAFWHNLLYRRAMRWTKKQTRRY